MLSATDEEEILLTHSNNESLRLKLLLDTVIEDM